MNPDDAARVERMIHEELALRPVRELGEGSFGTVYEAVDAAGEPFAVKIAHWEDSPETWKAEADLFRTVHPDVGAKSGVISDGHPFMVMKYVLGHPAKPLDDDATAVLSGVLRDLDVLHAHGYTHNDVKPNNVIVSSDRSRLIDFGIASKMWPEPERAEYERLRFARDEAYGLIELLDQMRGKALDTDNLALLRQISDELKPAIRARDAAEAALAAMPRPGSAGTPAYAPPEDEFVVPDARSDIYSAGATAYELAVGMRPKCDAELHGAVVTPRVARAIEKAIRCEPAERYGSAREMLEDLK